MLLDHVANPNRLVRIGQQALDPLFVRLQADRLLREPAEEITASGPGAC